MLSEDFKSGEVLLIPCDVISFSCESKEKTAKLSLPHTNLKTKGSSPLLKKRPRLLGMKPSAFKPPTKVNLSAPSPVTEASKGTRNSNSTSTVSQHNEGNSLEILQAKKKLIKSKETKVGELEEKLKSVEASDKDGNMKELEEKWATAIKDTLREMEGHANCPRKQDGSKMSIGEIIAALGIEPSAVGYDVDEEDFI